MKFFTNNLKPGVIAEFVERGEMPWGSHDVRGVIIRSQITNEPAVLWPKSGERYASTPSSRDETASAERYIMRKFREWRDGNAAPN